MAGVWIVVEADPSAPSGGFRRRAKWRNFGLLWINSEPTLSQLWADFRPTVGRLWTNSGLTLRLEPTLADLEPREGGLWLTPDQLQGDCGPILRQLRADFGHLLASNR